MVRFESQRWDGLTEAQRLELCRQMANEAYQFAENAPKAMQESYLQLAEDWLKLANELERIQRRPARDGENQPTARASEH